LNAKRSTGPQVEFLIVLRASRSTGPQVEFLMTQSKNRTVSPQRVGRECLHHAFFSGKLHFVPCAPITTNRLQMVPMTLPIVEAVLEGRRSDTESLLGAKMPLAWPGRALVERAFLARLDEIRANPDHRLWGDRVVITRDAEPRVIGSVIFHGGPDRQGVVEVAYGIEEDSQRQGFGHEAVYAAVEWAFGEPHVRIVRASTFTWHEPSRRILEKIGFVVVGTCCDILGEMLEYEVAREKFVS
jgi:RimJ/RimL family protein N-acetyltransferase